MSIWASIPGTEITLWDGEEGRYVVHEGFLDVATSGDRVRIIVQDEETEARISLDAEGICELHRRIVAARHYLDGSLRGETDAWAD